MSKILAPHIGGASLIVEGFHSLLGMRIIKYYTWEDNFEMQVDNIRELELRQIKSLFASSPLPPPRKSNYKDLTA